MCITSVTYTITIQKMPNVVKNNSFVTIFEIPFICAERNVLVNNRIVPNADNHQLV